MARRLGRDGWPGLKSPPGSGEDWFDTGDSRNRQSICRRNCNGGRNDWILNLLKLDQIFSLGIVEE